MTRLYRALTVCLLLLTVADSGYLAGPGLDRWRFLPLSSLGLESGTFNPEFVVAAAEGFVAIGAAGDGSRLQSWISKDGLHWRPGLLARIDPPPNMRFQASGLVAWKGGILAVGAIRDDRRFRYATWLSPDGHTWTAGPGIPMDSGGGPRWPAAAPHRGEVMALAGYPASLWIMREGQPWQRVEPDLPARCTIHRMETDANSLGVVLLGECPGHPPGSLIPHAVFIERENGAYEEITRELPLTWVESVAASGTAVLIAGAQKSSKPTTTTPSRRRTPLN